ncbi:MAG: Uma2 family endonuclease [Chitinophagales bacterium]|nr:Uma2 family endonuclease [Chitinophagales bacterium]
MAIELAQRLLSVQDYHKMIEAEILSSRDHIELINGKLIEMSPSGSSHAACIDKMLAVFNRLNNLDTIIRGQNPITLGKYSEPEPDIAIVKYTSSYYADHHPIASDVLTIIEVSDTSLEYDRNIKQALYANANIPEYWIVNIQLKEIEVYTKPGNSRYKQKMLLTLEDVVNINALGSTIPISQLIV